MDLRNLNVFIEVAELSSFTRAAEKLGYSQPTVSFQIKQLEQELGVKLFDRIGHTVSLTEAGRDALQYAQQICRMQQEMALGASRRRMPHGLVRLGMADSLCGKLIAGQFDRFRERYPGVSVQITTGGTGELFRLLDHNEVDLVCTLDTHVYDTNYVIDNEEKIGVHFVAAATNPLAEQKTVSAAQLLGQPFLLTEKGMSYRRLLDENLARHSMAMTPVLESGRADLLCELVERDVGLSFLPDYVTEEAVRQGRVVRLEVPELSVEVWKQLLHRRDKWISLPMGAMIRHLSEIILQETE